MVLILLSGKKRMFTRAIHNGINSPWTIDKLVQAAVVEWKNIPKDTINRMTISMNRRDSYFNSKQGINVSQCYSKSHFLIKEICQQITFVSFLISSISQLMKYTHLKE